MHYPCLPYGAGRVNEENDKRMKYGRVYMVQTATRVLPHVLRYHSKQYVASAFPFKTAILDKPMVAKLDNKSLPLTGIESSLPFSQQFAIGLYPESYVSSICHTLDPDLNVDITLPSASWCFLMLFSLQGFRQTYVNFVFLLHFSLVRANVPFSFFFNLLC